jgi:predicted ribosome quality control (RQC) complex YloA/Tae2 family protein
MVSFSNTKSPKQQLDSAASARDRYYYEVQDLRRKVKRLEEEIEQLKNANQDVAESLQEYIDIMEE